MSLASEVFSGNIYISIPGSLNNASPFQDLSSKASSPTPFAKKFIEQLEMRFSTEMSSQLHSSLTRNYFGQYELACFDQFECLAEQECYETISLFIAIDKHTRLAVVTLLLHEKSLAASQLLDRVSQDNLVVKTAKGNQTIKDILATEFEISIFPTAAKTCLSTRNRILDEVLPYYFANETYASDNMSAQITSSELKKQMTTNVAQYDSSDIFVGRSSVLRIDKREGEHKFPELSSDSVFLFIMEALLFKEAAVLRTNSRVMKAINKNMISELGVLENITNQFAATMPFWDIKVFKYLTAQQLANTIDNCFGINQHFELNEKNQQFLQYKISVRQSIEHDRKNKVLYLIAIILFVFEVAPYLFELFKRLLESKWLTNTEVFATLGAGLSTGLMAALLVFLIKRQRKGDKEDV
jgi:hypothetical protein